MVKRERFSAKQPFRSMLAAVLVWHSAAGGGAHASEREKFVDVKLAELVDADRRRAIENKSNKSVGPPPAGSDKDLRAIDVVSEEVAQELKKARALNVPIMATYLRRAARVPPAVDNINICLAGVEYDLPRVTLQESATQEELGAMAKLYPTRDMFQHKDGQGIRVGLKERTAAVLDKIGRNTSYLLVDASGCAAAVFARGVFSAPAKLGKRVLLLLNACMGLGRGFAKVYTSHHLHHL